MQEGEGQQDPAFADLQRERAPLLSAALHTALVEGNWIIFLFIRLWTQLQTVAKSFVRVG